MSKKFFCSAGLLAAICVAPAHANLLADGSFENVALEFGNSGNLLEYYGVGAVGPAWVNSSNFVMGLHTTYGERGPLYFVAQDGVNSLDLTGVANQGPVNLSQTLNLAAGNYVLSFQLGDISGGANYKLASAVNVLINNVQQGGTFTNFAGTNTANWATKSLSFSSLGGATTLTFSTNGLALDNFTGLDNVVLTPVPEPGTLAMWVAGLLATGFVAQRRKST